MTESKINGRCHCGNISITLVWLGEPLVLATRSCGVSCLRPAASASRRVPSVRRTRPSHHQQLAATAGA